MSRFSLWRLLVILLIFGGLAYNINFYTSRKQAEKSAYVHEERHKEVQKVVVDPEQNELFTKNEFDVKEFNSPVLTLPELATQAPSIVRALIESCGGWKLNKLPKLKAFLHNEAKNYENLEVKYIPGFDPKITFYDAKDQVVGTEALATYDSEGMHKLLTSKGIQKKKEEA